MDYVTYPNNQGTENYTYDDTPSGRGRLSEIEYPDGRTLSFSWNSRGKLTQLTAIQGGTTTNFSFNYDGMNRISQYIKSVGGIQQETWNFYYGPTGIDKVTRTQGGIQNLSIDYTTDPNGRILSMNYTETGGYSGELLVTYDNFGNMTDLRDNSGNSVEALLVDPNNSAITQYYNPADIDNPFTYRAREGFIGIEMWPGNDTGVYLQGHLVIPNPWGDVFTNGTTTTTTDDTTEKGGGSGIELCSSGCEGVWDNPEDSSCEDLARCMKEIKDRYGPCIFVTVNGETYIYAPAGGVLEGYTTDCDPTSSNYNKNFCDQLADYYKNEFGYDIERDADRLSQMQEWYWLKGCDNQK